MNERRRDVRHKRELEFSIAGGADEIMMAQSVNISSRGLLCAVGKEIKSMSKLKVTMELPFSNGTKKRLTCEGVVVRCEPEGDQFNVAIYFLAIGQAETDLIADYLADSNS